MSDAACSKWLKLAVLLLFVHCLLLAGLLYSRYHQPAVWPAASAPQLSIFARAINDAARGGEQRIVNTLFALNDGNQLLQWREVEGERQVKVVAWMSQQSFASYYQDKQEAQAPPEHIASVWVTLAPQVQQFCQSLAVDDPRFRLQQYLGLDPNRRYERFVEFWVSPEDIFRPCADPEPDDSGCTLTMNRQSPPVVKGISDYARWFERLQQSSYTVTGAPWTRLGYTYDWHYGQRGVGASEYIITPGATMAIAGNFSTSDYCQ